MVNHLVLARFGINQQNVTVKLRHLKMPITVNRHIPWALQAFHQYFAAERLVLQGVECIACFHDPSQVIVLKQDGSFVCYAELDGNKRDSFPVAFVEKSRKERTNRCLKNAMEKVDEINVESNPVITIEHQEGFELLRTKPKAKTAKWKRGATRFWFQD